jgi:hypothetical protein
MSTHINAKDKQMVACLKAHHEEIQKQKTIYQPSLTEIKEKQESSSKKIAWKELAQTDL